jgi:hypothetical protein
MAFQPWPETSNIAMVNAAIDGFVKALVLELTEGRKILVVHPPLVKESAEAMGMKSDGLSPASEVPALISGGCMTKRTAPPYSLKTEQCFKQSITN